MDFFNKLGEQLSTAGKTVAGKAKDVAELAKQNSRISDNERRMEDAFREIGRAYYASCESAPEGYEGFFQEVVEAKAACQL